MTLYDAAANDLLTGGLNFTTDDIRVILVDTADYTFSAGHSTLTDVPAAARVAVSGALASKTVGTVGAGVFDAADVTINGVTGDTVEALIVYKHTGTDGTSRLIRYIDKQADGSTNIAFTPNGGAAIVQWSAQGIVRTK